MPRSELRLLDAIDFAETDAQDLAEADEELDMEEDSYETAITPAWWDVSEVVRAGYRGMFVKLTEARPGSPVRGLYAA